MLVLSLKVTVLYRDSRLRLVRFSTCEYLRDTFS